MSSRRVLQRVGTPAVKWAAVLSLVTAMALVGFARGHSAGGPAFTIEQMVNIKFPSEPIWSPDGRHIAFMWDEGGVYSLYLVSAAGDDPPLKLMTYPWSEVSSQGSVPPAIWSKDGATLYYPQEGHLWEVAASGGQQAHPSWKSTEPENGFVFSPDMKRIAFARNTGKEAGSDLIVRSLASDAETHVAHNPYSIGGILWSPDGAHLAFTGGSQSVPHNLDLPYNGNKQIFLVTEHTPGKLYAVPTSGGQPVVVGMAGQQTARWIDNAHMVFSFSPDTYLKQRMIYVASISGGEPKMVHEDDEPKFWSTGVGNAPQPSPDGRWIAFLSDTDGSDHLYVMPATGGTAVKITEGDDEVLRPEWSHDSKRIAFDANSAEKPGDRQLGIATIDNDPAHATVTYITQGDGTNVLARWAPDDHAISYQHTDPENSADLFTIDAAGGEPTRLTESMPEGIDHSQFVKPELVHYPGAHGEMVPAWLFVPKNLDRSKKHPAIVWVHGDGPNQNYDGWHVQRHYSIYYAIHQYLLQEGYVVITPDYRGSIGYGRDWRTGVYHRLGVDDEEDVAKAADYLGTLGYVDSNRLGIWGLSFGGFFTLQTVTLHPTLFNCAVDVAGVVKFVLNYEDPWHGSWIVTRIGTPEKDPDRFAEAAPGDHVDQLQRPLLILAGTADTNVPYFETVTLIDQLLSHGKGDLVNSMVYPGEYHYFDREFVLDDAWHRVDAFFGEHLHPEMEH
jgi:dipeptidyl aminopeptidase/acylaminoacyl peptidase